MSKPMISVAGIRGVVGESLVPEEFLRYALAFAATRETKKSPRSGARPAKDKLKGGQAGAWRSQENERKVIVVGGDTRLSRHMVRRLVFAALESSGLDAMDLGICPTPTVGLMVRELQAAGGIAITASHNPAPWNALKFFSSEGTFLTPAEFKRVLAAYEKGAFRRASIEELGRVLVHPDSVGSHIARVLDAVNAGRIRRRRLKAVVDCCNGAGTTILPRLMRELGVETEFILTDTSAPFERKAEPLPENIGILCRAVQATGADIGFAVDPDADRLALVDEAGRAIGEERTLTLAANHWLTGEKSDLVANLSTTRALDDVAKAHGVKVHRTPIGEAHVVAKMLRVGAAIGGEGNGGVILPRVHPGRDAATGIALICEALASGQEKTALSALNARISDYAIVKASVSVAGRPMARLLPKIEKALPKARRRSTLDGLKLEWDEGWVNNRPSGTEPIIRIFAEARTEELAKGWLEAIRGIL